MLSKNSLWTFNENETELIFNDSSEIINDYQELFLSLFHNLSLEPNTPQMQLISYLTECDLVTLKDYSKFANYFFNGGTHELLDLWAWNMFRAVRKNEILGSVTIKISGIPNTPIPSGFIVTDGTQRFKTEKAVNIEANGSVEVLAIATELNEDICLKDTINKQVTPIIGVEIVNNPSSSIAGIPKETDTQFYKRCLTYNSLYKNSSFRSVMSALSQIDGVSKYGGFENPTSEYVEYKGATFKPHSFGAVLLGGDDVEIAETIRKTKAIGCDTNGEVSVTLTNSDNNEKQIYNFFRAEPVELYFSVKTKLYTNSPMAYENMIIEALELFVNDLEIGAYFTQSEVCEAVEQYIVGFDIADLQIGTNQGLSYEPIALNFTQYAVFNSENIKIMAEIDSLDMKWVKG